MSKEAVNITTSELARLIPVDPSVVRRWVQLGKLTPAVITAGGHYRFNPEAALEQISQASKRTALAEVSR